MKKNTLKKLMVIGLILVSQKAFGGTGASKEETSEESISPLDGIMSGHFQSTCYPKPALYAEVLYLGEQDLILIEDPKPEANLGYFDTLTLTTADSQQTSSFGVQYIGESPQNTERNTKWYYFQLTEGSRFNTSELPQPDWNSLTNLRQDHETALSEVKELLAQIDGNK